MKMNLPNKLTIFRIILSIIVIFILLFPFYNLGLEFPKFIVGEKILVDSKYFIAGILFIIASITDFLDGYIARKYNLVTNQGKVLDAIADKVLVNSVIIILSVQGFIYPIIPVILIIRDEIVNSLKMLAAGDGKQVAAIATGKIKTACLMVGVILTMFYNLPFELFGLFVSNALLIIAVVFSIISGVQYFLKFKKLIFSSDDEIVDFEQ